MAKISELKKVQLLEEAILENNFEAVEALFKEHKSFEFTARALGLACRFCGAEMVSLLLKQKASFQYEATAAFVKKYDCRVLLLFIIQVNRYVTEHTMDIILYGLLCG